MDWISCSRISDYLGQTIPHGRVYLPTASYFEMSEWTLPAASQDILLDTLKEVARRGASETAQGFVHGGFWRNFLTKYEESNNIHKKMLWVSEKVHRAVKKMGAGASSGAGKAQKMLDTLWGGQCNCAYWHGVFGGLYLPHLRQALYKQLIQAETLADKALGAHDTTVTEKDFDKDGVKEVLLESPTQNLYFSTEQGGSVFEWDLRSLGVNLSNVLTRRAEGYHKQLLEYAKQPHLSAATGGGAKTIHDLVRVKEPGLEKRLHYDWYRRANLLDHFFHLDTSLDSFFRCQYGEQGYFVKSGYQAAVVREKSLSVRLQRTGTVWTGEQHNTVRVEKTVTPIAPWGWRVTYKLQNMDGPSCELWFGSEMNFAFSSQDHQDPTDHGSQSSWLRRDHGFGIALKIDFENPMNLWEFPLETVSLSEEGFERTYQGTVLLAHVRERVEPGQMLVRSWQVQVDEA